MINDWGRRITIVWCLRVYRSALRGQWLSATQSARTHRANKNSRTQLFVRIALEI